MFLFRRKTIFHIEESLPDPEELKVRFRRRVLLLTLLGSITVLAFPVIRESSPNLVAVYEARQLAEKLLETRTLATKSRSPISLELGDDLKRWRRIFHTQGSRCDQPLPMPVEEFEWETQWTIQFQKESGEKSPGRTLCIHPTEGLLVDGGALLTQGKLLLSVKGEKQGGQGSTHLLLSQFGTDLQHISIWN